MILYLISLVFGSIIFLSMNTLFLFNDHTAKFHNKYRQLHKDIPPQIDLKERFCMFLDVIKAPDQFSRLVDEQKVIWSGIQKTHHQYVSFRWLLILVGVFLGALMIGFGFKELVRSLLSITLVLLFALGPNLYLQHRIRVRTKELERSLPDFLDMLTLIIEAGSGFVPALKRMNNGITGVLGETMKRVLIQMDLGFSRREALRGITNRVPSSDLAHFVEAIILSERLGTSLAKTMRVQAKLLRTRTRQRAEVKAQTAPIRIIPALVFFFLPSLLLIYLAPPIINFLLRR